MDIAHTTSSLRQEIARAFTPLIRDHGLERSPVHCSKTCETYAGHVFWVRASRDRKLFVDVAGASDPDSWFNILNVVHFLTGSDPRNGEAIDLSTAVGLVVHHVDVLRESFAAEQLQTTKLRLKRMREDREWKRWL